MKCIRTDCDNKRNIKAKLVTFDYSKTSGIDGCFLDNVKEYTCPKCKGIFHDIGDSDDVDLQIAKILLGAETLTRSHVNWLRTQYFKMSYFEFSYLLNERAAYLKELESHIRPMTESLKDKIQLEIEMKMLTRKVKFKVSL